MQETDGLQRKIKSTGIFDDLTLYIIQNIYEKNEISTWQLAHDYAKLRNDDPIFVFNVIRSRMKKLVSEGLFYTTKNGSNRNVYNMINENVKSSHKIFADNKRHKCIELKLNNKWVIFQL